MECLFVCPACSKFELRTIPENVEDDDDDNAHVEV